MSSALLLLYIGITLAQPGTGSSDIATPLDDPAPTPDPDRFEVPFQLHSILSDGQKHLSEVSGSLRPESAPAYLPAAVAPAEQTIEQTAGGRIEPDATPWPLGRAAVAVQGRQLNPPDTAAAAAGGKADVTSTPFPEINPNRAQTEGFGNARQPDPSMQDQLPVLSPPATDTGSLLVATDAAAAVPINSDSEEVTTFPMGGVAFGAEAVAKLGDDLPAVAAAYERTPAQLTRMLLSDKDLMLDASDKLLYKCSGLQPPAEPMAAAAAVEDVQEAYSNHHHHHHHHRKLAQYNVENADPVISSLNQSVTGVPLVHSRASSKRKIYLDFDGHITTGRWWDFSSSLHLPPPAVLCSVSGGPQRRAGAARGGQGREG